MKVKEVAGSGEDVMVLASHKSGNITVRLLLFSLDE
jgi:hypothetical protein